MKRALILLLIVVLAIPLAAIGAASWFLNDDALKARLVEQVHRATGRDLTIGGPISLAWSLAPTVELRDVALSNPPGFSRPAMAHVDRLQAQVALLPLFQRRVDVERIALAGPDVRLERDAQGRPNWVFTPPAAPATTPTQAAPPSNNGRFDLSVGRVDVSDARIGWNGLNLVAPRLDYDPGTGGVSGSMTVSGATLALSGTAGPFAGPSWPVDLHLTGSGAVATLAGTSGAANLSVTAPDLSSLSALAGQTLPPLHDVTFAAALSPAGPAGIRLHFGALGAGPLQLHSADITAPSVLAPATLNASAQAGTLPLTITGQLGSVAALLAGPAPVNLKLDGPGLAAQADGTLAATGAAQLQLTLHAPDLAATGAQAALALPAFRDLDLSGQLALNPGSAALHALRLTSAQGNLSGDLTYGYGARPSLRGALTTTSLDLGALQPPPTAAAPSVTPAPAPATAPAAPPPRSDRVIPDTKLPLDALRGMDADLQLTAVELLWHGRKFGVVQTHAVLQDGKLHLDPASVAVGPATAKAQLVIDATAQPPALSLKIDAPGLPAGPVLQLFGGPAAAPGTLDLRADLHGSGETVRAVAATLDGHVGLALVDSEIDNAVLETLAADALRSANLPLEAGGVTKVRCAALRADASAGVVQLRALTLDTSKLSLDGTGTINLGDESIDLHLQPRLRLGGGLSVPLRLRGTLAAAKTSLDAGAIAPGRVGIVLGGAAPPDSCGPALALARDGQPGPAPASPPEPSRAVKPADLLRGLFR